MSKLEIPPLMNSDDDFTVVNSSRKRKTLLDSAILIKIKFLTIADNDPVSCMNRDSILAEDDEGSCSQARNQSQTKTSMDHDSSLAEDDEGSNSQARKQRQTKTYGP